jgi:hypothetical protein
MKTGMNQANPNTEDLFEKARHAFFGTEKTRTEPNVTPTEFSKTSSDSSRISLRQVGLQSKLR